MTYKQALRTATKEFNIKAFVPAWMHGLNAKFREVRQAFVELKVTDFLHSVSCSRSWSDQFTQGYMQSFIDERRRQETTGRHDLLSKLIEANDAEGTGAMDDDELIANIYIFLVAGHEVRWFQSLKHLSAKLHSNTHSQAHIPCV